MLLKVGPRALWHPTTVWIFILALLFVIEYGVMLVLPMLFAEEPSLLAAAFIDSLTITILVAPVIWWTLVRPMRQVIRMRTQFLGDLFSAIEAERRQTAHELHDGIGQELSLLISGLRSAHETAGRTNEPAGRYAELELLAQKALSEVRRISRGLRPSLLDDLGLQAAVERVVADFREHASIDLTLRTSALETAHIPDDVGIAVYRIFQEALSNVVRHSGARTATIELRREAANLILSMRDDGRGFVAADVFEKAAGNHFGLMGIRERVALLAGSFRIETSPGRGCHLEVTLPLGESADV